MTGHIDLQNDKNFNIVFLTIYFLFFKCFKLKNLKITFSHRKVFYSKEYKTLKTSNKVNNVL